MQQIVNWTLAIFDDINSLIYRYINLDLMTTATSTMTTKPTNTGNVFSKDYLNDSIFHIFAEFNSIHRLNIPKHSCRHVPQPMLYM